MLSQVTAGSSAESLNSKIEEQQVRLDVSALGETAKSESLPAASGRVDGQPTEMTKPHLGSKLECSDAIADITRDRVVNNLTNIFQGDVAKAEACHNNIVQKLSNASKLFACSAAEESKPVTARRPFYYQLYVDKVTTDAGPGTFSSLRDALPHLADMGVTHLYLCPFLDSPLGDEGFDVSNYKMTRSDLGSNDAFIQLVNDAREMGISIVMDLVFNHTSNQSAWFKKALEGDAKYIDYYLHQKQPPISQKRFDDALGVVVDYEEADGSSTTRRLIFSDKSDDHFVKENIQGDDVYFYHTFYPFQMDLNLRNPDVILELADTLIFWNQKGVSNFRLDAVPFMFKRKNDLSESLSETHDLIKVLSWVQQSLNPQGGLLAEAVSQPKDLKPYFGDSMVLDGRATTNEFQSAYNFVVHQGLWASLGEQNNRHFWNAVSATPDIPEGASWVNVLRTHDEIQLENYSEEVRSIVLDSFADKGSSFRDGLGVAGRLASLLDHDKRKVDAALSILFTLPGTPLVYFGDEFMIGNDNENFVQQKRIREARTGMRDGSDARDLNRGPVSLMALAAKKDGKQDANCLSTIKRLQGVRQYVGANAGGMASLLPIVSVSSDVIGFKVNDAEVPYVSLTNIGDEVRIAKIELGEDQLSYTKSISLAPYQSVVIDIAKGEVIYDSVK